MLKSIRAVLAGYALVAALVIVATLVASKVLPEPTTTYLVLNLSYSLVFAVIGGYVTARIAPHSPLIHAGALAAIFLFVSFAASLLSAAAETAAFIAQPSWYPFVVALLGAGGVVVGGFVYQQQTTRSK